MALWAGLWRGFRMVVAGMMHRDGLKSFFRWLLAACFVAAGVNHFRDPAIYLQMMPGYLPWPGRLIQISGAAEILGGLGVLLPSTRKPAAWGLILLLLAVFPANVEAARHGFQDFAPWVLWARLPLQAVLIGWVYWVCLARPRRQATGSSLLF